MNGFLSTTLGWLLVLSVVTSQSESLIERARAGARDGKYVIHADVLSPVFDVPTLIKEADVIVHGTVASARPTLTPDHTNVITEYELLPARVYKNTIPPGTFPAGAPLRFWLGGGTVEVEGLEIGIETSDLPAHERLREGEQVVLFLTHDEDDPTRLRPTGSTIFSVFRVSGRSVRAMTRLAAERRGDPRDVQLATFVDQIQRSLKTPR